MTTVKTILFVENDLVSQTMYQKRLEREGYHVECAKDGQVALDILSERAPDLVLLDLMLPRVSGADVLKFMQADPRLTTVPVIIFSNAPLTEVPPDSALAQGTKRLIKSDCTFPALLAAIEETLATAPEFVVMEAGKTASAESHAAGNGESRRNEFERATIPDAAPELPGSKKGPEFLTEAAGMMAKIREHSMGYIKAPGSEASQTHLAGLHQRIHLLNTSIAQAACPRVALLTHTFDALLSLILDKPSAVTPSVLQTIAQAVDCLDGLLKNKDGYSLGAAFRARVLVVDDDTVCNHVNVTTLKRANFDPVGIKDPAAALELLETTPFDLVLLDINMPGMTGFDVCTKMRRLPHCKKTPVIFVTTFSNFDNRKQSVLSGGNDFVSKPITPSELALKVTVNLIRARVQGAPMPAAEVHPSANNGNGNGNGNGSKTVEFPATSPRFNQPAKPELQTPEPINRLKAGSGFDVKEPKANPPLRMAKPESDPESQETPEHPLASNVSPLPAPGKEGQRSTDIHEKLRQGSAALESARAGLERESAERSRIESQWREQLNSAEALVKQTETVLKEKESRCIALEKELAALQEALARKEAGLKEAEARCGRLEKEMTALQQTAAQKESVLKEKENRCSQLEKEIEGLQQTRDEFRDKFSAEQQTAAKTQRQFQELKASYDKQEAERGRLEAEWREQLGAAKLMTIQKENALKEKENRCGQLDKEIQGLQQTIAQKDGNLKDKEIRCGQLEHELAASQRTREELQNQVAVGQQAASKAQQEFQQRLDQANLELERSRASMKQQSEERVRLEEESREKFSAAKAAMAQAEAEIAGLQHARDDFQGKLATEQQRVIKSLEEIKRLQEHLQKSNAELEHAKSGREQESAKRAQLESECRNLTQVKDGLAVEVRNLRESHAVQEARLKDQQKKLGDGLRENIRLLQLRLQEAENLGQSAGD